VCRETPQRSGVDQRWHQCRLASRRKTNRPQQRAVPLTQPQPISHSYRSSGIHTTAGTTLCGLRRPNCIPHQRSRASLLPMVSHGQWEQMASLCARAGLLGNLPIVITTSTTSSDFIAEPASLLHKRAASIVGHSQQSLCL
jgi:hypothetical protein